MGSGAALKSDAALPWELVIYFSISGLSSILLLIVNKTLSSSFPFPLATVVIQNVCALLCTIAYALMRPGFVSPVRFRHFLPSFPGSILFVLVLLLSNASLGYVSLPVFVVANNLRPLSTAAIEFAYSGACISGKRASSLVGIALGAIVTALSISDREFKGLTMAAINTPLVSLLNVIDGRFMRSVKHEQTPAGINLYRLITSLVLLGGVALFEEKSPELTDLDIASVKLLLMSGITCTFAGVSLFELQTRTSATSIQVANVGFKIITTVVSLFTHGEYPSIAGWAGYAVSTAGVLLYSADGWFGATRLKEP